MDAAAWRDRLEKLEQKHQRFQEEWKDMLILQCAAWCLLLFFWMLPIPNPIKVLAVTVHEMSHGIAALLTGGRVFGFAVSPQGAGVTFGIGGNMHVILLAGYIGSCICGALAYLMSIRWKPGICIIVLDLFFLATASLGWLNSFTVYFGLMSMALMTALLWTPDWIRRFFIQMLGSACCLYAPLEVLADMIRGGAPNVLGHTTASDLSQFAGLTHLSPVLVGALILAGELLLLAVLVRYTCRELAKQTLRREKKARHAYKRRLREIRAFKKQQFYR